MGPNKKGKEAKDGDGVVSGNVVGAESSKGKAPSSTVGIVSIEAAAEVAPQVSQVTPEKHQPFFVIDLQKRTYVKCNSKSSAEEFIQNMKMMAPVDSKFLQISNFKAESDVLQFLSNLSKLNPVPAGVAVPTEL